MSILSIILCFKLNVSAWYYEISTGYKTIVQMSFLSSKAQKLLVIALSLTLVFWTSVSAHELVLCIGDNGHAAIESVLDDCCEHEASQETTIDVDACGNCTDLSLALRFPQTTYQEQLELPSLEPLLASSIFLQSEVFNPNQTQINFQIPAPTLDHNLSIKKITVLLV